MCSFNVFCNEILDSNDYYLIGKKEAKHTKDKVVAEKGSECSTETCRQTKWLHC